MRKTEINQKTDKKTDLGTTFLAKNRILSDFGVPGRSLGKALGRILGAKFGVEKKLKKKWWRWLARRVTRTPVRRDLGRIRVRWARSSTPSLILRMGGRIEPAEPEPPPAHFTGRIGGEVNSRSGDFVRPCWWVAGGESLVVRNWWRGNHIFYQMLLMCLSCAASFLAFLVTFFLCFSVVFWDF